MENHDTDDVFGDFESKVKGRRENKKHEKEAKHHGDINEKELVKRKYEEERQALKERYSKEMRSVHEKEMRDALKEGKFNPNLFKTQKIIYISIIAVLLIYFILDFFVVDLSLSPKEKVAEAGKEDITVTVVKEENKTAEAEEVKEEVKEETPVAEKKLSGTITLTMGQIHKELDSEVEDRGYITQVDFIIDNGKDKVLTPIVDVFIYDDEMHESWETRSRGTYTYPIGIKAGEKKSGSIKINPKTFSNLNIKKNIRLALNDTKSGFITAANDAVLIE